MNRILWALFGNDLDGVDANSAQAKDWIPPKHLLWVLRPWMFGPKWWRRITWWVRNPAHNLMFHVLGVVGKDNQRDLMWIRFSLKGVAESNWATKPDKWHICWIKHISGWRPILPFVSYSGKKIEWYAGWRERGNLGFALRRRK